MQWQEENNVKFNPDKFCLLRYNKKENLEQTYEIKGIQVTEDQIQDT